MTLLPRSLTTDEASAWTMRAHQTKDVDEYGRIIYGRVSLRVKGPCLIATLTTPYPAAGPSYRFPRTPGGDILLPAEVSAGILEAASTASTLSAAARRNAARMIDRAPTVQAAGIQTYLIERAGVACEVLPPGAVFTFNIVPLH